LLTKYHLFIFLLLGRDPTTGKKTGSQTSKATDIFQCCTQAESCPGTSSRTDDIDTGSRVTVVGLDSVSTNLLRNACLPDIFYSLESENPEKYENVQHMVIESH
jgi:hypothetical protein